MANPITNYQVSVMCARDDPHDGTCLGNATCQEIRDNVANPITNYQVSVMCAREDPHDGTCLGNATCPGDPGQYG